MNDRVVIVGAGRAGRGLARALRASGVVVAALVARRPSTDDPDGAVVGELAGLVRGSTAVLLAVQDAALSPAVAQVAAGQLDPGVVVLQLSGSAGNEMLGPARARGHAAGTFHPLVPLADPARAPLALRGAWIGVGGDPRAVSMASRLAAAVGARTLALPASAEDRAAYHAAAVIASNFPVMLAALAERLFVSAGVDRDTARGALWRLMHSAVENLRDEAPLGALTGPIVRGDVTTVARHLGALTRDPAALDVYVALSAAVASAMGDRIPTNASRELWSVLGDAAGRPPAASLPPAVRQ